MELKYYLNCMTGKVRDIAVMTKTALINGLSGIAQIVLFDQPKIGVIFFLGITLSSPYSALTCIVGAIFSNIAATIMKYPNDNIQRGLYGFNGALLGLALPIYFPHPLIFWICLLLGCFSVTVLYEFMSRVGFLPLTFPFVLITWLFVKIWGMCPVLSINEVSSIWNGPIHGVGQIFFAESPLSSFVIWAGIAFGSWREVFWVSVGAMVGALPALWWSDNSIISEGLISLNVSLCFLALLRLQLVKRKQLILVYGIITVFIYLLFYVFLSFFTLPVLTFPFIFSVWIAYFVRNFQVLRKVDINK